MQPQKMLDKGGLWMELGKLLNLWLDFNMRRKVGTIDLVNDVPV
ncbi:hypothetical protein [Larkinella sp. C7]|nr:hypothetical protein [Larkinella sp. C7]